MPHHTKRHIARALIAAAAVIGIVLVPAAPASATVHEIVAQWCSGQDPLGPPGVSGRSNADNFARPLIASGFITGNLVPFEGDAGPGLLIEFDYDVPNGKVVGTGEYFVIDPTVPVYVEQIAPDPDFPAFKSCPRLTTG